jgi:hypothetical protein
MPVSGTEEEKKAFEEKGENLRRDELCRGPSTASGARTRQPALGMTGLRSGINTASMHEMSIPPSVGWGASAATPDCG